MTFDTLVVAPLRAARVGLDALTPFDVERLICFRRLEAAADLSVLAARVRCGELSA